MKTTTATTTTWLLIIIIMTIKWQCFLTGAVSFVHEVDLEGVSIVEDAGGVGGVVAQLEGLEGGVEQRLLGADVDGRLSGAVGHRIIVCPPVRSCTTHTCFSCCNAFVTREWRHVCKKNIVAESVVPASKRAKLSKWNVRDWICLFQSTVNNSGWF